MDSTLLAIILVVIVVAAAAIVITMVLSRRQGSEAVARLAALEGRLQQFGETQANAQAQLNRTLAERLDTVSKRLGDGLVRQTTKTGESLKGIHERLAVMDAAQKNITELSQRMIGLQDILSNKQARGAFGEIQLENLVREMLPPDAYAFQATLGNRTRVDCLLRLPNPPGAIAIDAKFPLESYSALRAADDEAARVQASRAFGSDVQKHVRDIAEKYIVPGETAESALMFLPSEAVYAELHANFRNVIEESFKRRVWIVSPTTLMATLNTIRAILKDARMREQAGLIQAEVQKLLVDVERLDKRVSNLQSHFDLAVKDVNEIRISSDKVTKRGLAIEQVELGDDSAASEDLSPPTAAETP